MLWRRARTKDTSSVQLPGPPALAETVPRPTTGSGQNCASTFPEQVKAGFIEFPVMLRGVSINERPGSSCSSRQGCAQRILEEYLEPRHHDHEGLLDRLVEVLDRPSLMVAVDRLQRGVGQ